MSGSETHRDGLAFLVDLRVAQYNGDRGIPAYAQSIVRQLCLDHPRNRYIFLWDERLPRPAFAEEFEGYGSWELESSLARGRRGRIDVLFTACFFLPLHSGGEEYLYPRWLRSHQPHRLGIVYDLIPYLFPERYLSRRNERREYLAGFRVMRESDRLFAISQATRLDTIRLAGYDPARIRCVYGDIDHRKRALIEAETPVDSSTLSRYGLRRPYAISIGGDDWRKNMDGMVRAFAHFHARFPDRQLAVICKLSPQRIAHFQLMASSLGIRPGALVFTGYVSDEDLVALTRQAEMMVYPSLYEGLGLPVLEAYGCGVPVIGSNGSSIKELVIPELTCDPHEPAAIADAMGRLADRADLRERSLARGRELLGQLGWPNAVRTVMAELTSLPTARGSDVAVVGVLPPATTAIASYTLAHLQSPRWQTDFFDANPGPAVDSGRSLLPGNRILPVEVLLPVLERGDHGTAIFVLGNSAHHAKALRSVMQTRLGCRQRRLAYLHEVNLTVLLRFFLGSHLHDLPSGGCASDEPWIVRALTAIPEIGQGLRFLAETARLDGLIVNSDACRRLVRAGLVGIPGGEWPIHVAMLPIVADLAERRPARPADAPLHVGTFGTGGDTKQFEPLAKAIALIGRHRPVTLSIAGWSVARQCRRQGLSSQRFIAVHDSPTDEQLASLMRDVDVAVQLRVPTHGESSAAVARLLGLGTPVVVTAEGSFTELPEDMVTGVPAECDPAILATAIESAASRRLTDAAVLAAIAPWSPEAFADRLSAVFGENTRAGKDTHTGHDLRRPA